MSIQSSVSEYCKNVAKQKVLKERQDELRDKLIPYLKKHASPTDGPFLLELSEIPKMDFSWKDYAYKLARKVFGEDSKKQIKMAIKKAGTKTVDVLTVKINSKWKE
jgi:hypothetical protein